jgi:predicted regulator of Ras-like GTPase activity (Roadblock/LC7/MglB family)
MEIHADQIKDAIDDLLERTGARTAMLVTREGYNVVDSGDVSSLNPTAFAALAAGMFSATREIARMVGEKGFANLLQQGENRHIHVSMVKDTMMLVVIFTEIERIGKVRFEARKTTARIEALLEKKSEREDLHKVLHTPEFKDYALQLIDRIFR